jgi:hypothetical protein
MVKDALLLAAIVDMDVVLMVEQRQEDPMERVVHLIVLDTDLVVAQII